MRLVPLALAFVFNLAHAGKGRINLPARRSLKRLGKKLGSEILFPESLQEELGKLAFTEEGIGLSESLSRIVLNQHVLPMSGQEVIRRASGQNKPDSKNTNEETEQCLCE